MVELNSTDYGERDLIGYGKDTPENPWPNNAKIAINFVLNYEEGSERNVMLGDARNESIGTELGPSHSGMADGQRDINAESFYEYGSRAGVWRILRLFDENKLPITVFGIGQALYQNPQVPEHCKKMGHEVCSHGWRWIDRSGWTEEEEVENIKKAVTAITETTGKPPVGWYYGMVKSKAGERSRAVVARTFKELGLPLKYYSDSYADDLPYYIESPGGTKNDGLLIVPYALDTNDFKCSGYQSFISPEDFSSYLIAAFDELYREGEAGYGKMLSIGMHCRMLGRPARLAGLRKFVDYIKTKPDVWITTREEIADHWMKKYPYHPKD